MSDISEVLQASNSWAMQCAKKLLKKLNNNLPKKGFVLFGAGYGPSGLPHIGTFGEVVRTKFVQHAFSKLSGMPTKLAVTSDDYDGLRKVPEGLPNQELLEANIDKPLTSVPDPFGTSSSFGSHMNEKLIGFLDSFGFEYDFMSATELYTSGKYDKYLLNALKNYDKIMGVMLPTLGEDRQKTYSPFLPICPKTGKVLYVPTVSADPEVGTIKYIDPSTNEEVIHKVTGGGCKLQWKPDFGVRWAALDVDFEMYGKDHLANGPIYSKICKIVGGKPPEQFVYELFLDEQGRKISKSKGNETMTVNKWLKYAPTESLSLFMYQNPQRAKKLYEEVLPKSVDEYITYVQKFHQEDQQKRYENPAWHIHHGDVPVLETYGLSYSLLLNLASACNPTDKSVLWGFVERYIDNIESKNTVFLDKIIEFVMNYYNDYIKNTKSYRIPTSHEKNILLGLIDGLKSLNVQQLTQEDLQNIFYRVGKSFEVSNMREYFQTLYEILLGQSQGPRFGSFVLLYGVDKMIALIEESLNRSK